MYFETLVDAMLSLTQDAEWRMWLALGMIHCCLALV